MIMVAIKNEKDITARKMIKRELIHDMTDFLQMLNALSNKRRRQINKNKQKASIEKISSKIIITSSLNSSNNKELLALILATKK